MAEEKKTKRALNQIPRGSKYNTSIPVKLINHMAKGHTADSFCGMLNISPTTLNQWYKRYPEMLRAKEIGLAKSLEFYENIGIQAIRGEIKNFSSAAFIFLMKNMHGWSDRTDLRISATMDEDSDDFNLLKAVDRQKLIEMAKSSPNTTEVIDVEPNGKEKE